MGAEIPYIRKKYEEQMNLRYSSSLYLLIDPPPPDCVQSFGVVA